MEVVDQLRQKNEEQQRVNEEAERQRQSAEEHHQAAIKATKERDEALWRQIDAFKRSKTYDEEAPSLILSRRPFFEEIDQIVIPRNFRELTMDTFDNTHDRHAQVQAFCTQVYISGGDDAASCKLFPGTLRGTTMQWFSSFPPRSVNTFSELATRFMSQFAANKGKRLEVADLFDVRQHKEESLKQFLARFNNVTIWVDDPDQKFFVKAFQKGLMADPFSNALVLQRPTNMDEIRARAEKHIEAKENSTDRQEIERRRGPRRDEPVRTLLPRVTSSDLSACGRKVEKIGDNEEDITLPGGPPKGKEEGRNKEDQTCVMHEKPHRGTIATIAGRFASGGITNSARKQYTRLIMAIWGMEDYREEHLPIVFTNKDYHGLRPHKGDPMVISVVTVDYKIERVLINQGSLTNILYWNVYKRLELSEANLLPCPGALVSFSGEQVEIRGCVDLRTTFEEGAEAKTFEVQYMVVNAMISYNVILGRPALNALNAIVSTLHLCLKYLVGDKRIGTIRADQTMARRCYEESLKVKRRKITSPNKQYHVNFLDLDPMPGPIRSTAPAG